MENGVSNNKSFELSSAAETRVWDIIQKYPKAKSAIMPALYVVQDELGWLPDEAYPWVAKQVGVSPAHVRAVATFYTMYYKKPVGKYHIQVCRTLSCMLCGAKDVTAQIVERFGLRAGEVSDDGMWSFEEVECLGSCGSAPMVEINDVFFENLTTEKLNEIFDRIEKEQPDLRYSTLNGRLAEGLSSCPKSEAWTVEANGKTAGDGE